MNPTHAGHRRGFTLVELLVVVSIIALLLGLILVATAGATKSAQRAATVSLMRTISTGLEQFKQDFGYYPPLLADNLDKPLTGASAGLRGRYVLEAQPDAADELREYRYFSLISLGVYLVGDGELVTAIPTEPIDTDPTRHDGVAGPGLRDPGPDRSWGGAISRNSHRAPRTGRVYGPYIDVSSGRNYAPLTVDDISQPPRAFAAVQSNNATIAQLSAFFDPWGRPIRYYVPHWPARDPDTREATLEYTPIEVIAPDAIRAISAPNYTLDPMLDRDLPTAPYVLLSGGPDGRFASDQIADNRMLADTTNSEILSEYAAGTVPNAEHAFPRILRSLTDNIRLIP